MCEQSILSVEWVMKNVLTNNFLVFKITYMRHHKMGRNSLKPHIKLNKLLLCLPISEIKTLHTFETPCIILTRK